MHYFTKGFEILGGMICSFFRSRPLPGSFFLVLLLALIGTGVMQCRTTGAMSATADYQRGDSVADLVQLFRLDGDVWLHRSSGVFQGKAYAANGLLLKAEGGYVLIDTPWNDAETENLLHLVRDELHSRIVTAIVTHAHADRMGGIRTLQKNRIPVLSTENTARQALANGYPSPMPTLSGENEINLQDLRLLPFFPGPAHTSDNIVVWIPGKEILFGGCMIKSMEAKDLGNTGDANVSRWGTSIQTLQTRFPGAQIVIPGHGEPGGRELLEHTASLLASHGKVD